MSETTFDTDVIVVGSGFGGSVSALRLAEKGWRVTVLEAGRRWRAEDFPAATGICAATSGCRGSACAGFSGSTCSTT